MADVRMVDPIGLTGIFVAIDVGGACAPAVIPSAIDASATHVILSAAKDPSLRSG